MIFFKAQRTPAEIKQALVNKVNLNQWWQDVRNEYTSKFFSRYQTRMLDKSIALLIADFENDVEEQRTNALHTLQKQVTNWLHMHAISHRSSHRMEQVKILKGWLKEQLGSEYLPDYKQTIDRLTGESVIDNSNKLTIRNNESLYNWWKRESWIGWFKCRSEATRELDKAIKWFSQNIILFRLEGLQELSDAIDIWLLDRKTTSERVPAIKRLQMRIAQEMQEISDFGSSRDHTDEKLPAYV